MIRINPLGVETVKGVYTRLAGEREEYVKRAQRAAKVTIPSLFPEDGSNSSTVFKTPAQSLGARGVNNLASKILQAIMPPNLPFFRLDVTDKAKKDIEAAGVPELLTNVQYELSKRERTIMKYFTSHQFPVTLLEGFKQALVAGNYLFFMPPKEQGIKGYRLDHYVIKRDGLGKTIQIIALDIMSFASLDEKLQRLVELNGKHKPDDKVEVYTHVYLDGDKYRSYQEVNGYNVLGSNQEYPLDKCPWMPIRMIKVEGEDYGRGYVEEQQGDLEALNGLAKAVNEYAALCSRIIYLVNPNGQTQPRRVNQAKTGDFVSGRREDITALTLDKYNDFQVAKAQMDTLKSDLSMAFLLNSAVQRNAERVTAEEIRYVARELESGLGGLYSILSVELQLPLVRRAIVQLQNLGALEQFPDDSVEPSITTGIEALGRGQDLDNLNQFLQYLTEIEGASAYAKIGGILQIAATALGIDVSGLIRTDEEVNQQIQEQRQMELASKVAPNVANGAMQAMNQGQQQ